MEKNFTFLSQFLHLKKGKKRGGEGSLWEVTKAKLDNEYEYSLKPLKDDTNINYNSLNPHSN